MTHAKRDKPMTKYRREMLEAMPSVSKCIMPPCENTAELTQCDDGTWGYTLYCDKCWMDTFSIDVKLDSKATIADKIKNRKDRMTKYKASQLL